MQKKKKKQPPRRAITGIDIVFENVEVLRFNMDDFLYAGIYGVQADYEKWYNASDLRINFHARQGAELHIRKEANQRGAYLEDMYDGEYTPFGRIKKFMDITALNLMYKSISKKDILVPYEDIRPNVPEESRLQTVAEKKDGTLCIRIWPEGTEDSVIKEWITEIENK